MKPKQYISALVLLAGLILTYLFLGIDQTISSSSLPIDNKVQTTMIVIGFAVGTFWIGLKNIRDLILDAFWPDEQ